MQDRMEDRVRRETRKALKLSAHHANMALQMLIEEGKIAAGDVAKALKHREKLIKTLRAKLALLETASRPAARKLASASPQARPPRRSSRPQGDHPGPENGPPGPGPLHGRHPPPVGGGQGQDQGNPQAVGGRRGDPGRDENVVTRRLPSP